MSARRFYSICIPALLFVLWLLWLIPAHADTAPVEARLETLLTASEEAIDLAETVLLISRDRDPALDTTPLKAELDRLTESARQKISPTATPEAIVEALITVIHEEAGYDFTDRVDAQGIPLDPAELFVHGMLTTRRGYCMNLSILYLILADRLRLPLYGVALPNHFFVRYESGGTRINIEATARGARQPDTFYRQRFNVDADAGFFMTSLSKKQTLGAYLSNVGMVYYKDQQPDKAVFYLELSTRINTRSIEAHNNLANIYSELGRQEQAIAQYQLALAADPDNTFTLYNLGLAFNKVGKPDRAIESLLQVVQIQPGFIPGHRTLVRLYLKERRYLGALLHLKQMAALDPENISAQMGLGNVYLRMNEYGLAQTTFENLRKRYPEKLEVLDPLAETYYRKKDFDRAIELYRYLIENHPGHLKAYVQLGWTHYRKGDLQMALSWTRRGIQTGKGTRDLVTLACMNLGFFNLLDQNFPESKSWYKRALAEKDPSAVSGMIQDIQEAARKFSGRPELEYFTGWIYFQADQKETARPILERYVQENTTGPFVEEARDLLASMHMKKAAARTAADDAGAEVPEGMVRIPAGFFPMGSNEKGDDERPQHKVYLDTYFIDRHEVSARQYAEFLNAVNNVKGYYLDNKFGTLLFDGRFGPRPGLADHPVNNVNWKGAQAYCKWKGKRLPSEAEWEKAARGTDGRMFPWGDTPPTHELARYFQTWTEEVKHGVMVPVQAMEAGKSPYGLHHMAGNVKEWVEDWYDREYYMEESDYTNPQGPIGGEFKVLRGGSWRDLKGFIYSTFRNNSNPATRLDDYGFRCAKGVAESQGPKTLTRAQEAFPAWTVRPSRYAAEEISP